MLIYKLFLDELVTLREVYAPYCARQSQVADVLSQIVTEVALIEEKISQSRRDGKTQAFNLNSLLIKPVQRVTKYPLLLEQVNGYSIYNISYWGLCIVTTFRRFEISMMLN